MTEPGTYNGGTARWRLEVVAGRQNGDMVLTVGGRLAAATAPQLSAALASAIAGSDRRIVLDLKGLDYISSAGVLVLETVAARLRSEGRELLLRSPTPPVRLALTLAGFPDDVRLE